MLTTLFVTGPRVFHRALRDSGDRIHEVPAAMIETLYPMNHCIVETHTEALRKRFPHAYSVHHMRGSWVIPPPCWAFRLHYQLDQSLDILAAVTAIVLLAVVIAFIACACMWSQKMKQKNPKFLNSSGISR
jgi:hypothetical protein